MSEKLRYSDVELEEFRESMLTHLIKAKDHYEVLKSTFGDASNLDTSPDFKGTNEGGADTLLKEERERQLTRQEVYIKNLNNAMFRIENKTYGICRDTGDLIPKNRLTASPVATQCMDAKMRQSQKVKVNGHQLQNPSSH